MDVKCGLTFFLIVAYAGYAVFVDISGSGFVYPGICYNITCTFGEYVGTKAIGYEIKKGTTLLVGSTIFIQKDPPACVLQNIAECQGIQNCSCDPDGLAAHYCYYHTGGGNGELSLSCSFGNQGTSSMTAKIAGKPENINVNGNSSQLVFTPKENEDLGPLQCNATCFPSCTFWWTGPINSSDNVLSFTEINRSANGTYLCESSNGLGTDSIEINIIVYFGPNKPSLSPNSTEYTIRENQTVTDITCSATCQPKCKITWRKSDGLSVLSNPLRLQSINRLDAGTYVCNASNDLSSMVSSSVIIDVTYGPGDSIKFNSSSTMITKKEGEQLHAVVCSALCNPECLYKWTKAGVIIIEGSVLAGKTLTKQDHGLYECRVWNDVDGVGGTKTLNLTVQFGPAHVNLSSNDTEYKIKEHTSLSDITCSSSCRPECTITWTGPNGFFVQGNKLRLQNISRNQKGIYRCNASNVVSSIGSSDINIVVTYGAGNSVAFNISSTNITKVAGDIIYDIKCSADCNPVCRYLWTKNGSIKEQSSILSLDKLTKDEHGTYICNASNGVDPLGSTKALTIIINYAPEYVSIIPNKSSYKVKEGQPLSNLTCSAMCRPECEIFWEGDQGQASTSNVLVIKSIVRNQTGQYRCIASNNIGSHPSAEVQIHVMYSAEIRALNIDGNNFTILENQPKNLKCIIDGFPFPSTRWHFNEDIIPGKDNVTVYDMTPNCEDTGNYTCTAFNSEGNSSTTKEIFVICSPRSKFSLPNKVAVGNNSILHINVTLLSYPKPHISWGFSHNDSYFQDVPFNSSFGINQHLTSIHITNMKTGQYGYYEMLVRNGIQSDFRQVFKVIARRQPDTPTNFSAICENSFDSADVEWRCEFNGGETQQFELYYAVKSSNLKFIKFDSSIPDKGYKQLSFSKIDGLSPRTWYIFKVVAFNAYGSSDAITASCNTTSKESETSSNNGVVTGVAGGLGAACILVGIIIGSIYVIRRYRYKGGDKKRIKRHSKETDEDEDGLKTNPLYVTAGEVSNAEVGPVYGVVNKKRQKKENITLDENNDQGPVYSQVKKTTTQEKKKGKEKKRKNTSRNENENKDIELGTVYENSDKLSKLNSSDELYGNAGELGKGENAARKYIPKKNKDGLIYADLDLDPGPNGRKFVIRGIENKTNYAMIDLSIKVDPLPSDDDEEDKESENAKSAAIECKE